METATDNSPSETVSVLQATLRSAEEHMLLSQTNRGHNKTNNELNKHPAKHQKNVVPVLSASSALIERKRIVDNCFQNNDESHCERKDDGGIFWKNDHASQLRSRFLTKGYSSMLEHELLELLLIGASPKTQTKELVQRLVDTFGDLNGVLNASQHRISKVENVTPEVVLRIRISYAIARQMAQANILDREIVSCWSDLLTYCKTVMAHRDIEQFRVFYLNQKNAIIADELQAEGTVNHVPVYPREVAKRALELNACAIILVHNHPSGDPSPSQEDIQVTKKIMAACKAIDVSIHDHLIIGKNSEVSLRSDGHLD